MNVFIAVMSVVNAILYGVIVFDLAKRLNIANRRISLLEEGAMLNSEGVRYAGESIKLMADYLAVRQTSEETKGDGR